MTQPLNPDELVQLGEGLLKPTALIEVAVLAACLFAAFTVVRWLRGAAPQARSIWFGRSVIDGVLFPVLALLLALLARFGCSVAFRVTRGD